MKLKLEQFLQSKYYLISVSIFTFLFWFINIDSIGPKPYFDVLELIGISIFVLVMAMILILFKETIYTFPLLPHAVIMLSNQDMGMENLNEMWILYVVIAILIGAFIYHFIKFKIEFNFGKLGLGLSILAGAYLLSIIGYLMDSKPFDMSILMISSMGLIYLALYLFYRITNEKPFLEYIFRTMLYLSIVVILQTFTMMIFYYIDHLDYGSFIDILKLAIDERWGYEVDGFYVRLNVGWGVGNNIGGVLAMLLPINMYFLFKDKKVLHKVLQFGLMLVSLVTIVLTTSRGAYLGVLAFGLIFLYAIFKYVKIDYRKYKKQLIIGGSILLLIAIPLFIYMLDFFIGFMQTNSFLNGREEDWTDAIKYFLESPIFGKSWYSDVWENNSFRSYHNTILHTLATMGLVGLLALIYHHFELVKLFIKKWGFKTLVVAGVLIVTHVHGLVDNTYYAPLHMFTLIVLYVGLELEPKETLDLETKEQS
ncbi:O-antigen ligase family protein [Acholeplasma equirhinis]|uniref:O-antigen ligase family protein n=1 Tax=Acholeplasma equirhinis TaxID=555393 RepID=UPI00197ADD1E|nr:O-antigen ligase family protein [Acholeplasma equirhinis]MBN3489951.1 O-antigen ligase family protein [Acholeplasma equirhinis]